MQQTQQQTGAVFLDRSIPCVDCGDRFIWSAGQQAFFRDVGLQHEPKRCTPCKNEKKNRIAAIEAGVKQHVECHVTCFACNQPTTVPFYPSKNRPVYCRRCFQAGVNANS